MRETSLSPVVRAVGAPMKGKKPTVRLPTPPELADVALIDARRCAAAACVSLSTWYELVGSGNAPAAAIKQPRFTRWRLAEVRDFLAKWAERGGDPKAAQAVVDQAVRASTAARAKRQAAEVAPEVSPEARG